MKKRMKKISAILLAFAMTASMLAGCGSSAADSSSEEQTQSESQSGAQETESEPVDVNVTALKGPTAMGMVQMMDDADNGKIDSENYQFTIAASIDEVTPSISQGEKIGRASCRERV